LHNLLKTAKLTLPKNALRMLLKDFYFAASAIAFSLSINLFLLLNVLILKI
jgi:hypothetical protein